jgi:hypothetical protein
MRPTCALVTAQHMENSENMVHWAVALTGDVCQSETGVVRIRYVPCPYAWAPPPRKYREQHDRVLFPRYGPSRLNKYGERQ